MLKFLISKLHSIKGAKKLKKLERFKCVGKEFCNSPMYSNKYIHIYRNFTYNLSSIIKI
jgi:hypothetical protein